MSVGVSIECTTCRRTKAPRGRSVAPATSGSLCDDTCAGYRNDPKPSDLWPGEVRPVCSGCGSGFPFHDKMDCGGHWVTPDEAEL